MKGEGRFGEIMFSRTGTDVLLSVASLVAATAISALVLKIAGHAPVESLRILVQGALGGRYELSESLIKTCPLVFTGLAVSFAFRAGLFNIGAEGQLLTGATASAWTAIMFGGGKGGWFIVVVAAAAFVAGGLWGAVAGVLKTERNVNEVIGTLMLNFTAFWFLSWLVHGPMQEAARSYPQSEMVPEGVFLARILPPTRLHTGIIAACVAAVVSHVVLFLTPFGLRLRVAGLSPRAARVAGVGLRANTWLTLFLSGGLAGLAGGFELLGVSRRLYEQFSPGYGFMAIAVALLARLHPLAVIPSAFFFGALETGAGALQRASGVSSSLAGVVEAVVIFSVVVGNAPTVRRMLSRT